MQLYESNTVIRLKVWSVEMQLQYESHEKCGVWMQL
jgi:hypothetical protein